MKKVLWLIALLLIILLLILLYRCDRKSESGDVRLGLGPVGYSLWGDGTLAVAIPIVNSGNRAAADVKVAKVILGSGNRIAPAALPVPVGEIVPTRRAVLDARFASLAAPGKYPLTVSGTYVLDGRSHPFTAQADLLVERSGGPPSPPAQVNIPKQKTTGVPIAPLPIMQENDNNPAGPPIPDGPVLKPFTVAPTNTGAAASSGAGSSVTFVRDTGTGQSGNFPPDPTLAATASAGGVVFASGNTYVLFSKDDGQTFTRVNPTTIGFPSADGGMCCDQVILYNPRVNLFFWLIQYNSSAPNPPNSALPGPNRLRIAWASPESMKTNINAWTFFDLTSASFNLGQQALDFPDLAFTGSFLYVSVDRMTAPGSVLGLIVARVPLSDITGNGGSVSAAYYSTAESSDMNFATGSHLTQNGVNTMYWGGHVDASHIKVFRWRDGNGSMDSPHDAVVNTWCKSPANYVTLAPDKQQWLDSLRTSASSIIGATHRPFQGIVPPGGTPPNGEVWLAWGAGADDVGGPCTQGRPQPYVKIARVDDETLDTVGEYHIWNTAFAFAYPALATDPNGNIGVSVAFGGPGPGNYASTAVGYLGDFVVYFVEASDVTLTFTLQKLDNNGNGVIDAAGNPVPITDSAGNPVLFTRYGDYFSVRNSGPDGTFFSSQGYAVKLVNSAATCMTATDTPIGPKTGSGPTGCGFRPHYEQWGRPVPPGPH
jgi:hypothetical protein